MDPDDLPLDGGDDFDAIETLYGVGYRYKE